MHLALEAIWLMLGAANRYFSAQEPWVLRKSGSPADQARFATVLYTTCEAVRIAALLVQPVMPDSAGKLLDLLGQSPEQRSFAAVGARLEPGTALPAPPASFPATRSTELTGSEACAPDVSLITKRRSLSHRGHSGVLGTAHPFEQETPMTVQRTHIVVIGGGYAGTMAANHLRLSADTADITLVNPRPVFVERIRLHQLVAGTRGAAVDYGTLLGNGIRLLVDNAERIDTAAGTVD